ncbi:5-formyltetrahydrofolate cyclo-ligase [Pseudoduganella sp. GCM10020061]|uniref:5-formyltetrahydrofolate cyclo-ligase n=1 Tax=Pseudoduganella sp. GCM10020061 TaxID=3317345 RepID=UPI00363E7477
MDKAELRREMSARRRALEPAVKARYDAAICARLVQWWQGAQPRSVAVYWPLKGEPDIGPACAQLQALGVQLVLPVVVARDAALAFAEWTPGEEMIKDEMGVAIPAHARMAPQPEAVVIPCLGYNEGRFRLGYGGGYYDRTLEATPRPMTVGVAYSFSKVEFDSAEHDVALDVIITE